MWTNSLFGSTDYYSSAKQDFWGNSRISPPRNSWVHTSCVSCHNGRGRLEKINLFLAPIQRSQFWQLSAFFPRTRIQIVTDDAAAYRLRLIFSDQGRAGREFQMFMSALKDRTCHLIQAATPRAFDDRERKISQKEKNPLRPYPREPTEDEYAQGREPHFSRTPRGLPTITPRRTILDGEKPACCF